MKNTSRILLTLASVLFLLGINSCNDKEFLTVEHYSILPADQMFKSDKDALAGLVGCYDYMLPGGDVNGDGNADADGDWGFKPNLFIGGHPTMDTQATGWDKDWNTQNWTAGSNELLAGWRQCYGAINRCNIFLVGLKASTAITPALKTSLDGQAWVTYFTACPAVGGWGSLYLSWEWWNSYEQGDKRRDASGVQGAVPGIDSNWKSATNYGYNPYLQQSITKGSDGSNI